MNIRALAASAPSGLVISESLKNQLGLPVHHTAESEMADSSVVMTEMVGPVLIRFNNRSSACFSAVLP
ncbi:MAG: hypothetical protein LBT46_03345, partial [Planctomycetaceae bacterium]|nr:hypothetical protein [Planctomycetaceae bacterium]